MRRIAALTLLIASSMAWSMPANGQGTRALGTTHHSRQADKQQAKRSKRAIKDQEKANREFMKSQKKAAKRASKRTTHPTTKKSLQPMPKSAPKAKSEKSGHAG